MRRSRDPLIFIMGILYPERWFYIITAIMTNYIERVQVETFSALQVLCVGNPPVTGGFPSQRPVTRGFDTFFDLHRNKRLSKQFRRWGFETPSRPLYRFCNGDVASKLGSRIVSTLWSILSKWMCFTCYVTTNNSDDSMISEGKKYNSRS